MTILFNDSRMDDQIAIRITGYTPVQSPFEHRKCLLERKRLEWTFAVELEQDLRLEPFSHRCRALKANVKISEVRLHSHLMIGIKQCDAFGDALYRAADVSDECAGLKENAGRLQSGRKFTG